MPFFQFILITPPSLPSSPQNQAEMNRVFCPWGLCPAAHDKVEIVGQLAEGCLPTHRMGKRSGNPNIALFPFVAQNTDTLDILTRVRIS